MNLYKHTGNIKAGLFILGITLIIGLLTYTQSLVTELRNDNRQIVRLYAEIIANIIQDDNDANLNFVFENIIQKVKFPLIQTSPDHHPQMWKNLPKSANTQSKRERLMKTMDKLNEPIPLIYSDANIGEIIFGYLHYGDSRIVGKLQLWTYFEIVAIAIFIFLGFTGFSFIRNNEKRHIWVGMARETAHQLGTPVSALMGWVDWLKEHPEKTEELIPEMEADLLRLEQIGRRFSKMGSKPEMEEFDLSERVERVVNYLMKRMPSLGKKVELINDIQPGISIKANGSLLAWSIENIIRNGIDAIDREDGKVTVSLRKDENAIKVRIQDNGKGIPKKDWRNIFRPGFSTKRAGWGLGLSLSTRIVEEIHSGRLHVIESSPKNGTIIEISF
ncbi:MAG: HAMP domain-containing histidine kinase [Candidatus Marinimicrobia bacterium]|jgi:signal transduction histidine kinase|nr:HAMP domain-containing histidine kinase [Candidatus Neomarinimicrobiota bacterium]MBT3847721.1 HAMP domain-containing histidine kinase [Candidatus Neomarinimicrobiota bacterium]MBT4370996.1 HAMP domain-containing histidine kinase [Candidatus Neomarinimicrobiota bacterium]MBT4663075.1 HAMP domain-containing histidine kinase [Candidatus Neomarinimicrobiota bacterium]MBT5225560.1 HAMP domain-containing histidine kinase [Candidatus Neomarinimicrobiota bacterium]